MVYKNIASVLNNSVLKNALGLEVTIAEDLSNIVEYMKKVSELQADNLKDFKRDLVVTIHNEIMMRMYESKNFDILKNAIEYAGGLQRIMSSGLATAYDSHLLNLVNGTSYLDGKFYGLDIDARVTTNTKAFKVIHSISDDDFKKKFSNAQEVSEFIGLIMVTEENTINVAIAELSKRLILENMTQAYNDGRNVPLLTKFNEHLGNVGEEATPLTLADIHANRDLTAYFTDFCKACVSKVVNYIADINKKYNDGEVATFTPISKVKCLMLTDFAEDIKFLSNPITFNNASMPAFETVNAWQNHTDKILPSFEDCSKIVTTNGTTTKTYENIVGAVYDIDSMGITVIADKVTVEPVGAEGFTNFHHHLANNYYIDTRFSCVTFTLD